MLVAISDNNWILSEEPNCETGLAGRFFCINNNRSGGHEANMQLVAYPEKRESVRGA